MSNPKLQTADQLIYKRNEILFAKISLSTTGTIVAADTTRKIKVLSYVLVVDAAVSVKFQSNATDLTGAMSFIQNGGISSPLGSPALGWLLETKVNEPLKLNLSTTAGVQGHLSYLLEE